MSRIYNKYVDEAIRSIEPTLGQEKTKKYKKKLKLKKKSWKDHVDTSHASYKKEYEGL